MMFLCMSALKIWYKFDINFSRNILLKSLSPKAKNPFLFSKNRHNYFNFRLFLKSCFTTSQSQSAFPYTIKHYCYSYANMMWQRAVENSIILYHRTFI